MKFHTGGGLRGVRAEWFMGRDSLIHPKMDFGSLGRVGVQLRIGVFVGLRIAPDSGKVSKRLGFIARSPEPFEPLQPHEPLFEG